ncbi:tetratricopeptide repeat-containing sensor histidine kinase [Terrimonas pollutisoli]|uniref:tetratricopeptide repeat-containing sensor histidine kinase n=1 Tax=Terrimonas pollutisoli TaxID=3034147 RepID=UPI0023ED904D|nr:ATP-binding protein [Terrimonas sp. H1YJ31]
MKNLAATLITILSITVAEAQQSNQFYIDSLKNELTIAKEDTNKVRLLAGLSYEYVVSSADTGVAYAQQALDLAKKLNFEDGILEAEGGLAWSLTISGNYPLALDHSFKTLSLAKKINPLRVPWAYALVFWCYYYLGEYNTCLSYTRESLKLADTTWELPYAWRDLAMVYHRLNQPDSALLYAKKAFEKLNGSWAEGNISHVLGDTYAGKSNYDSALFFYRNGISVSIKNNITDLIDSYNGIAGVYKATNNFDSAAWYSKKVLSEKIEKRYPIGMLKAANMLADIYGSQNKPDSTLKYLRIALNVKDSLFSREKTMAIQNLAYKEQEKQKEIEASELKYRNQLRTYSLLGGLIALLVIAGILFRNNRNKQKANALLQQQKEKIESTLTELKSTQAQLIQAEKMASLGELTAGIAHEIQNPLNFVNNFSDVNKELIAELKTEIKKGNIEDVNSIADDIEANEEKISHHGKRADAIVKGMLQHSRSSSGIKEPTNINALADEYLRLAYHGLRAKDKSFNARFETDFDPAVEKINVVSQDIGRVILNLINNAFYSVTEKRKQQPVDYEPTVSVRTRKLPDKIEISIKDNGNGIPQLIMEKMFQPFFTTKPTGKGTGLGLSLSYDIVTKGHNGLMKAESKEGEFAEFIIQLPM